VLSANSSNGAKPTALLPNGATAKGRGRQNARLPRGACTFGGWTRHIECNVVIEASPCKASRPVTNPDPPNKRREAPLRRLASAPLGSRAVWQVRGSAGALLQLR